MRRFLIGLLVVLALVVIGVSQPATSYACTCEYVEPLDARGRADAVLAGRVVSVAEPPAWPRFSSSFPFLSFAAEPGEPIMVTLAVDRVWKGVPQGQVEVIAQNPESDMCGTYFVPSDAYLVYAMDAGERLRREFCQRVVQLPAAADDLAQLGPRVVPPPAAPAPARNTSWGMATIRVKSRHLAGLGRPDAISAEPAFKRQHAREDAISGMRTMPLPAERRDPSATRSEHTGFLWHPRHESGFVRSKDEKTTQPCEIKSTANAPVVRLQAFRVVMR